MLNHYQQAAELLRQSKEADTPEQAALLVAQAQVHATLALVEATNS